MPPPYVQAQVPATDATDAGEPSPAKPTKLAMCYELIKRGGSACKDTLYACGKKLRKYTIVHGFIQPLILTIVKSAIVIYVLTTFARYYMASATRDEVVAKAATVSVALYYNETCWTSNDKDRVSAFEACVIFTRKNRGSVTDDALKCVHIVGFCTNYNSDPQLYVDDYIYEMEKTDSIVYQIGRWLSAVWTTMWEYNIVGYLVGDNRERLWGGLCAIAAAIAIFIAASWESIKKSCCRCCCLSRRKPKSEDDEETDDGGEDTTSYSFKSQVESPEGGEVIQPPEGLTRRKLDRAMADRLQPQLKR